MADVFVAALSGIVGVLVTGYFNNFLGEDFKRFRDAKALAGGLAGELESHLEALPALKAGLNRMWEATLDGQSLSIPEWPMPSSPVFEANTSKIGLLGPELAREIAYGYESLRAFRLNFHQLTKHHQAMPSEWASSTVNGCLAILTRAEPRGDRLVVNLKNFANLTYLEYMAKSVEAWKSD